MKRVDLFVIDGQNDFLASGNEPDNWPTPFGGKRAGALYVTGADQEALNLAAMIKRLGSRISKIHATLDSHHHNDGSHNTSWKMQDGSSPPPFTQVSHQDVLDQKYVPRFAIAMWQGKVVPSFKWAQEYTKALEQNGRATLTLWPVHCEINTWGSAIYHPLKEAYDGWVTEHSNWINYITKGEFPFSEHYSGLRADVPDPSRPDTQLNIPVINDASEAEVIVWSGWAGSHCLRWTALDAINHFGSGSNDFIRKSVFLKDASAPVPNPPGMTLFSDWYDQFLDEVDKRGGTITTTDKFLASVV